MLICHRGNFWWCFRLLRSVVNMLLMGDSFLFFLFMGVGSLIDGDVTGLKVGVFSLLVLVFYDINVIFF